MTPEFLIKDTLVVLHPLDMVFVAIDQLDEHVMSLTNCGQAIADALDGTVDPVLRLQRPKTRLFDRF